MRTLLALALLSLAGCSLVGDGDPFDDAYLDVHTLSLDWVEGAPPVTGRIGLTYIASDVVYPDDPCPLGGGFSGRWELNDPSDRFPEGGGSVRGRVDCEGIRLYLFDGDIRGDDHDRGVLYILEGERLDDRRLVGTWDRVGAYPEGTFTAPLVREATAFVTVP